MARPLRRPPLILALPALVAVSTGLHWLAASRVPGLWIMPDEAVYADRALGVWHRFSLPILHGRGSGYSVLYPVVAGVPFAAGSLAHGYDSLKLFQSLVVSLAAVPVFFYGRRAMPNGFALLAAALTVASPLLLYAGFVMTEVVYYPLSALALTAVAHAVTTARTRDQLLALAAIAAAILTRVQGVAFVAVFAIAILLEALMARDRSRLKRFLPVWVLVAAAVVVAAVLPSAFGAYAGTVRGGYPAAASLRLVYDHLAFVVLLVAVAPAAAGTILAVEAFRGRERDPWARALIAVATATVAVVVVQVGMFAARYAPHLLGRDLAAIPPTVFLVFCLWLARGGPRPRFVASASVFAVAAVALAAPWNRLAEKIALPDTPDIAPFLREGALKPATLIALAVAVTVVLVRYAPRRMLPLLPAAVLAVLVASSVSANRLIAKSVRYDQAAMVGMPRDWIERATAQPVAYVYAGDPADVNVVWQQRFWNPRIAEVVSVAPSAVPGPIRTKKIVPAADGRLPITERLAVANNLTTFLGTPVANQDRGLDYPPLTLWRLDGAPRLNSVENGVKPNGDIIGSAGVTAYGCRGGTLQLTLLPKATDALVVALDGRVALRARIGGRDYWNGSVSVPAAHTSDVCHFTIRGGLLLGSTRIVFAGRRR